MISRGKHTYLVDISMLVPGMKVLTKDADYFSDRMSKCKGMDKRYAELSSKVLTVQKTIPVIGVVIVKEAEVALELDMIQEIVR